MVNNINGVSVQTVDSQSVSVSTGGEDITIVTIHMTINLYTLDHGYHDAWEAGIPRIDSDAIP